MALTPDGFAAEFQTVRHALWVVALAVLGGPGSGPVPAAATSGRGQRLLTDAEDVVQEAALVALGKLDQFEPGTSFIAWMSQIVRHLASNARHKTQRRRTFATDFQELDVPDPASTHRGQGGGAVRPANATGGPVSAFGELAGDQASFDDAVVQALDNLEATARACLLLRGVSCLTYREISAILSIPEGTAMSHVHRARRVMRELLVAATLTDATPSPAPGRDVHRASDGSSGGGGGGGGPGSKGAGSGGRGGVVGGSWGVPGTGVTG